jgi:hypothetical protein
VGASVIMFMDQRMVRALVPDSALPENGVRASVFSRPRFKRERSAKTRRGSAAWGSTERLARHHDRTELRAGRTTGRGASSETCF